MDILVDLERWQRFEATGQARDAMKKPAMSGSRSNLAGTEKADQREDWTVDGEPSKPDGRDDGDRDELHAGDGSTSSVEGLTLTDRDRALIIIAQEICGYLQTHREGDLEQIETRMMAYLATVGQCATKDQG